MLTNAPAGSERRPSGGWKSSRLSRPKPTRSAENTSWIRSSPSAALSGGAGGTMKGGRAGETRSEGIMGDSSPQVEVEDIVSSALGAARLKSDPLVRRSRRRIGPFRTRIQNRGQDRRQVASRGKNTTVPSGGPRGENTAPRGENTARTKKCPPGP